MILYFTILTETCLYFTSIIYVLNNLLINAYEWLLLKLYFLKLYES